MAVLGLLASGCSRAGVVLGQTPIDLVLPEGFHLGFNHRLASRYRSPLSREWRNGDNLEQMLIDAIRSAEEEILVAIQELSLPRIAQSLVAASRKGVNVKVILENNKVVHRSEINLSEKDVNLLTEKITHELEDYFDTGDKTVLTKIVKAAVNSLIKNS